MWGPPCPCGFDFFGCFREKQKVLKIARKAISQELVHQVAKDPRSQEEVSGKTIMKQKSVRKQ
jgi:hypothetical protein